MDSRLSEIKWLSYDQLTCRRLGYQRDPRINLLPAVFGVTLDQLSLVNVVDSNCDEVQIASKLFDSGNSEILEYVAGIRTLAVSILPCGTVMYQFWEMGYLEFGYDKLQFDR